MTDQAVYTIFRRITERADMSEITLRDLRRAYLVSLIRASMPLEDVQYLAGHASWFTTAAYRDLAADSSMKGYALTQLLYRSRTCIIQP